MTMHQSPEYSKSPFIFILSDSDEPSSKQISQNETIIYEYRWKNLNFSLIVPK